MGPQIETVRPVRKGRSALYRRGWLVSLLLPRRSRETNSENPMTEITLEMLRRFAELGGWSIKHGNQIASWDLCDLRGKVSAQTWHDETAERICMYLPDFRTNLQACFDVLEAFCGKRGWHWSLAEVPHGGCALGDKGDHFNMTLDPRAADMDKFADLPEACALTIQDAIILAVLKAAEGGVKS